MLIGFLLEVFTQNRSKDAIVWQDQVYTYQWLLDRVHSWLDLLKSRQAARGMVTVLEGDSSPNSIALLLALIEAGAIVVPVSNALEEKKQEFIELAQGELLIGLDQSDRVTWEELPYRAGHELYGQLKSFDHPGLVLFSSGSTGKSKGVVHDFTGLLEKFRVPRQTLRTIAFLLYDHIGGLNTILYTLSNAGCLVTIQDRSADGVLGMIEKYRVDLLPTSPTFINLLLLSEAYNKYDLSSLKLVTYGTEPMPEFTLKRFARLFPWIRLQQTYGLSEMGILRSRSRQSDSLWVKIGGEGVETRVVDGILQIKTPSTMLGYLNAPSPFTEDGWFNTGDSVEVDGEYFKILGRKSEIINVGGQKVYPAEVESVLQEIDNVMEVTVFGEANPIVGNIVCARVRLLEEEDPKEFAARLKRYCKGRLQGYQIPVKVQVVQEEQHNLRFKKIRAQSG